MGLDLEPGQTAGVPMTKDSLGGIALTQQYGYPILDTLRPSDDFNQYTSDTPRQQTIVESFSVPLYCIM
jgi:hypothetical protein